MSGVWTQAVVSTDILEMEINKLIPILRQTRSSSIFPSWTSTNVHNAFLVAECTSRALQVADSIQKQKLQQCLLQASSVGTGTGTGVMFVDRNPSLLIENPVKCLVRAILSSPLLTWISSSASASGQGAGTCTGTGVGTGQEAVLSTTLYHAAEYLGKKEAVSVMTGVVKESIDTRLLMSYAAHTHAHTRAQQLFGQSALSMLSPTKHFEDAIHAGAGEVTISTGVNTDEVSLAVELLCAVAVMHQQSSHSVTGIRTCAELGTKRSRPRENAHASAACDFVSISSYAMICNSDLTAFRILCVAASLSIATIATRTSPWGAASTTTSSSMHNHRCAAAASWWIIVYEHSRSQWIYDSLRYCLLDSDSDSGKDRDKGGDRGRGLRRYSLIDPRGHLMQTICRKNHATSITAPTCASAPGASAPGASAPGASAPGASAPGPSAPGASASAAHLTAHTMGRSSPPLDFEGLYLEALIAGIRTSSSSSVINSVQWEATKHLVVAFLTLVGVNVDVDVHVGLSQQQQQQLPENKPIPTPIQEPNRVQVLLELYYFHSNTQGPMGSGGGHVQGPCPGQETVTVE